MELGKSRDSPLTIDDDDDDEDTGAEIVMLAEPPPDTHFSYRTPQAQPQPCLCAGAGPQQTQRVGGYLVVDTNFVVDHAAWLQQTRHKWWGRGVVRESGMLALVVPWVVLRELDGLKERRKSATERERELGHRAQECLRVLLALVKESSEDMVIQRMDEVAMGPSAKSSGVRTNDDRVLQCAVHFRWYHADAPRPCTAPRVAKTPTPVLLLSGDVDLQLKAHAYDIQTMTWPELAALAQETTVAQPPPPPPPPLQQPMPPHEAPQEAPPPPLMPMPQQQQQAAASSWWDSASGLGLAGFQLGADDQLHCSGFGPTTLGGPFADGKNPQPFNKWRRGAYNTTGWQQDDERDEEDQRHRHDFKPQKRNRRNKGKEESARQRAQQVKRETRKNTKQEAGKQEATQSSKGDLLIISAEPVQRKTERRGDDFVAWVRRILDTTLGIECENYLNGTTKGVCQHMHTAKKKHKALTQFWH